MGWHLKKSRIGRRVMVGCSLAAAAVVLAAGAATASVVVHPVPATSGIAAVACESTTVCVGVGSGTTGATVTVITNGVPGATRTVASSNSLLEAACWSSTRCVALGDTPDQSHAVLVPITSGVPGVAVKVPHVFLLWSVACLPRPSTTCYAVGQGAGPSGLVVRIDNGVARAPVTVSSSRVLTAISCPTAANCYATGQAAASPVGVILTITNGTPGALRSDHSANELYGIGCVSATVCYADGRAFNTSQLRSVVTTIAAGVPGQSVNFPVAGYLDHLACLAGGQCLASGFVGQKGLLSTVTNGAPGPVSSIQSVNDFFSGVCLSSSNCIVGGTTANFSKGLVADTEV